MYKISLKKSFLLEPEKTNFKSLKFHKRKSCAWWFYMCYLNSCEIWNLFSQAPIRNCLWCYYWELTTSITLEKCEKEWDMAQNILVQGFCPVKIEITQFSNGVCLKYYNIAQSCTINPWRLFGCRLNSQATIFVRSLVN